MDRFVGAVARGDAGAPGRHDYVDRAEPGGNRLPTLLRSITQDSAPAYDVPGSVEQFHDRASASISGFRAGIADRQHETTDAGGRHLPGIRYRHGPILDASRGLMPL